MEIQLPKRKNTRLKGYNYNSPGAYFITICTENRKNLLSRIVGEGSPLPQLSYYGKIVEKWIHNIPEKYPQIKIDSYVIMPNHIHLILTDNGRGDPSPTVNNIIGWFKYEITKDINLSNGTAGKKFFQRSFYDHIIRNQTDYNEIYKYILENPIRWHMDKLYAEE